MPTLTRNELLLITAITALPGQPWRHQIRGCGMRQNNAEAARDSLLKARVIRSVRVNTQDALGRARLVECLEMAVDLPFVQEVKAWLAAGQSYRWPGPDHPRPRKQREVPPPGAYRDPVERLLETILRNPRASWTRVRALSGLRGEISLYARRELEDRACVHVDVTENVGRDGRRYARRALLPNENNALVQELRKRYGLKAIAPIVFEIRKVLAENPAREGSPWRVEDIDTDPTLHAKERLRRES